MEIIAMLLMLVSAAAGLGSLVCWILTLIKIFKDNVGLGILGIICGLFAFIYGWMKVEEYQHKKIMLIWSGCFAAALVCNFLAAGLMAAASQ